MQQMYGLFELKVMFINMQLASLGKPPIYLQSDGGKYSICSVEQTIKSRMTQEKMNVYLNGFCDALDIVTHTEVPTRYRKGKDDENAY